MGGNCGFPKMKNKLCHVIWQALYFIGGGGGGGGDLQRAWFSKHGGSPLLVYMHQKKIELDSPLPDSPPGGGGGGGGTPRCAYG